MTENHFLGIDFGNNFSSVGAWIDSRVEILSNGGTQTIPSCVLYKNEEILVGHSAWRHLVMNATNTIYDLKRLIGKPNIDVLATNSLKYWPFKFSYDEQSLPTVEITIKEDKLKKKPEEVAGKIFEKLKEASPSTDIVMSMPVLFDNDQKQSLKEAAKVAGLNVVEFISDPTAALYAYAHEFGVKNSANLLIFDFGGSKCDVMVAQINGEQANVLAVGGDLFLGGRDIDHLLMDYFAEQIKNKHKKDVFENAKTRQRLLRECIEVKHTLANMNESGLFLGELFPEIEDEVIIDIETFNTLCQPLFNKIEQLLNGTLKTADLKSSEIQEVVIVGGSTRIPSVKEILHLNFPHAKLNNALHPDEAIAYGAAVRAAQLCELTKEEAFKFIVNDNDAKRFCLKIFEVENQDEVENQEKEEDEAENQEEEETTKTVTEEPTNTTNDDGTSDSEPPKPPPRNIVPKNEDVTMNKELKENNQPSFPDKRRETLYQEVQKWIRRLYNCNRIPYIKLTDFETRYSALMIENASNGELTLLRSNAYQEFRNMILQNEIVRQMEQLEVEINNIILLRLKSELLSDIKTLLDDVLQQDDEYKSGDTFRIHAQKIQAKLLSETNVFESNETIHRFKKLLQEPRDH